MDNCKRAVLNSWRFTGHGYYCTCKLDCGHVQTVSYRKDRPPKTVTCQQCKREKVTEFLRADRDSPLGEREKASIRKGKGK